MGKGKNVFPSRSRRNGMLKGKAVLLSHVSGEPVPSKAQIKKREHELIRSQRCDIKFQDRFNFFHSYFGFNPPLKILVDSTFIYSLAAHNVLNPESYLWVCFGGRCELSTTACVIKKLSKECPNNSEVSLLCRKIHVLDCLHSDNDKEIEFNTFNCMTRVLSNRNQFSGLPRGPRKGKYILRAQTSPYIFASQNFKHLHKLRQKVGVPVVYFDEGLLNLDKISDKNHEWANTMIRKKMESLALAIKNFKGEGELKLEENNEKVSNRVESKDRISSQPSSSKRLKTENEAGGKVDTGAQSKRRQTYSPDICDVSVKTSLKKYKSLLNSPRINNSNGENKTPFRLRRSGLLLGENWDKHQASSKPKLLANPIDSNFSSSL